MKFLAQAPANIALVKYMGKRDFAHNLPANPSLSLTLNECCTVVEIELSPSKSTSSQVDINWMSEDPSTLGKITRAFYPADLDQKSRDRAIQHVRRVHDHIPDLFKRYGLEWDIHHHYKIRSANTFPQKSGLASSASSFAALTLCAAFAASKDPEKFTTLWQESHEFRRDLSIGARRGSGSSCRSLEGPWVLWESEYAEPIMPAKDLDFPKIYDLVVLVDPSPKKIASTDAHNRVMESPLWNGREARAIKRLETIRRGLTNGNVAEVAEASWEEMWEMHSLFHTSRPPFTYFEPETLEVLRFAEKFLNAEEPPIVTIDAGPNPHLLVTESSLSFWKEELRKRFPTLQVIQDQQGHGATVLGYWD